MIDSKSIQQISELYSSGLSLREVAALRDRSVSYVKIRLRRAGVSLRPTGGPHIYSCNEDFFETIDTEEKAYWLGFLAADGCVGERMQDNRAPTFCLSFSQSLKNVELVEGFKRDIDSTHLIRYWEREKNGKIYKYGTITIYSRRLFDGLVNKGVIPRKSLILKPLTGVPERLTRHGIRGYFDGDGCVFFKRTKRERREGERGRNLKVTIAGTKEVLEFIQRNIGGMGHLRKHPSGIFYLHMGAQDDIRKFASYIYKDVIVCLGWKRRVFFSYDLGEGSVKNRKKGIVNCS